MKLKPYTLREAQSLVSDARMRSTTRHERWKLLLALYRYGSIDSFLDANSNTDTGSMSALVREYARPAMDVINMVLPHTNILVNSTVAQDPRMVLTPVGTDPSDELRSKVGEAVLAVRWKETRATDALRRATHDSVKLGKGIVKVGWTEESYDRQLEDDEIADELQELVADDLTLATEENRDPTPIEELRNLCSESVSVQVANKPYVEYVNPFDIFVPPNARRLDETRWVAQRIVLPLDEIRANEAYSNLDTLTSNARMGDTSGEPSSSHGETTDTDSVFQYAELFEFYDLRTRRMLVFQESGGEALYDGPMPDGLPQGSPFVEVRNYEVLGDEFWGFGDLDNIAPLQSMLNFAWTQQMENLRASGAMYAAHEDHLDEAEADLLAEAEPGTVIRFKNLPAGMPAKDAIGVIERQPLDADVYEAINGIMEYQRQVFGVNDFQAGGNGSDRMSATAAALVDGVASTRGIEKRSSVEDAAAGIAQRILWLCQVWMTEEESVRVAGPEAVEWVVVNPEDLEGTFDVIVEKGTTSAINPATRAQKALQTIQVVIPAAVQLGYDPDPLFRQALRHLELNPDLLQKAPAPDPALAAGPEGATAPADPALAGPAPAAGPPALDPAAFAGPAPAPELSEEELLSLLLEEEDGMTPDELSLGPESGLPSDAQLGGGIALS